MLFGMPLMGQLLSYLKKPAPQRSWHTNAPTP
jgi:hypothetical protein